MSMFRPRGVPPLASLVGPASLCLAMSAWVATGQTLPSRAINEIWKVRYAAEALNPNDDTDGDGLSNAQEAVAGTDPFDPHSATRITTFTVGTNGVHVRMRGELGKRYELQGS